MQTRYIGDVGDFGKYGLLRALIGEFPAESAKLLLGVVWYLVSKHEANNDGKHDSYLNLKDTTAQKRFASSFRECDTKLYDALRGLRLHQKFQMADIHDSNLFPKDTKFYDAALSYIDLPWKGPATADRRIQHRTAWFEGALKATQGCEVVFVDPDNGLESGVQNHELAAPKYAYFDELKQLARRGQSLVIYHHFNRQREQTHNKQLRDRLKELITQLQPRHQTLALRYHRGSGRVFFVVPCCASHENIFANRVKAFLSGAWGKNDHFTLSG